MGEVKRQYRQTRRAEQTAATRRKLAKAAFEPPSPAAPAAPSLSAVAHGAGVSRPTLYSHFPDEAALFRACTLHHIAQDPPPDPTAWRKIDNASERLRVALRELYAHYARNQDMLDNVFRDMHIVESMREFNLPLVEQSFAQMTEILTAAYEDPPGSASRRAALVAVAISFDTWKPMTQSRGLDGQEALELMARAVEAAVE